MSDGRVVSIVMSAYKPRPDWFREAVTSALDQRDCEFELIVVDDGSPEPVERLLTDIEDPRLRVLRVEHRGLSDGRNVGARAARGGFVRFVDADDTFERRSTARLLRLAGGGDGDAIAYGATLLCDERLQPYGRKASRLEGWIAHECLLYRFDVKLMSMLFPRWVLGATGEWDATLRQCQDWDYVLRALEQAPVRGEQEIATYYRRHGTSASANLEAALHYESLVVSRYFERHPDEAGSRLEREARAKLLMVRARNCPVLGRGRRDQLGLIARAIALHPSRAVEELGRDASQLVRRKLPEAHPRMTAG